MEHTENKTIIHDTEKTASWEQQTATMLRIMTLPRF